MNPAISKKCGVVSNRHSSMSSVQPVDPYQSIAGRVIKSPHNRCVASRRYVPTIADSKSFGGAKPVAAIAFLLGVFPVIVKCTSSSINVV